MSEMTHVGFLGLGNMGAAMALRLIYPGYRLHVYDPNPGAVSRLVDAGAVAHASPRSVADAAAIVMACLPSEAACEAAIFGQDGVAAGNALQTYVEMSTIGPTAVSSIAERLQRQHIATVDAPVSGGPAAARAGTLSIMLAGANHDIALVMPSLARIAKTIHNLGDQPGQAQAMKLVNNIMLAANMAVASEALAMGAKAGLSADAMADVIQSSTGQSAAADILARFALPGSFDFGAHMSILAKDVELAITEARNLGVPARVLEQARGVWHTAMEEGRSQDDFTSIIKSVEERANVLVRGAPRR
ncbi:NAD(P)-dependent oxidoreductase (plasmid) [Cupriavidus sp. P-10]|uniref:NAD(P)-dependent oxidoreductase n=1 Tax=Cupriavidus sp. P-10 TaxID=2027911 RepID=UPI000E2E584F|nr:NAD(P)-dependent oxidoreductase [Cupriavidus sp. P-10]BDB29035.1 NAD(P)-dependent oxidoreductase [Cupriavidus sp. P-10]